MSKSRTDFVQTTPVEGTHLTEMELLSMWREHMGVPEFRVFPRSRKDLIEFYTAQHLAWKNGLVDEDDCPGHVASSHDVKICGRCGIHIDSLRPDEDDD